MIYFQIFFQFVLISLLAFGGGKAALPMVERVAVKERAWITPQMFSTAVAFGYITPGPVLITATFVGHQAAGIFGAIAATVGAFLCPFILAALTARGIQRFSQSPWLKAFGKGAAPAVIGVLGVTLVSQGKDAFLQGSFNLISLGYVAIALSAAALSLWTKVHPILIVFGGVVIGFALGLE